MTKASEHLQFIRDRLVYVYGENPHVDFVIRLDKIIEGLCASETEIVAERENNEADRRAH